MTLTPTRPDKGLRKGLALAEFKDRYDAGCIIQESSLAGDPCIWLGVMTTTEGKPNDPMHLTQDTAADLIPLLQRFVETGKLIEPPKPVPLIPVMDDPLGKYWLQPADIRDAPIDDETIILTRRQFDGLAEYSTSMPSGVYPGKCWKAEELKRVGLALRGTGRWLFRWYGEVEGKPDVCSNNQRLIVIV